MLFGALPYRGTWSVAAGSAVNGPRRAPAKPESSCRLTRTVSLDGCPWNICRRYRRKYSTSNLSTGPRLSCHISPEMSISATKAVKNLNAGAFSSKAPISDQTCSSRIIPRSPVRAFAEARSAAALPTLCRGTLDTYGQAGISCTAVGPRTAPADSIYLFASVKMPSAFKLAQHTQAALFPYITTTWDTAKCFGLFSSLKFYNVSLSVIC